MYSALYSKGKSNIRHETSYKVGLWEYYSKNGQIQAKGQYQINQLPFSTGVENQFKKVTAVTDKWMFFNEDSTISLNKQKIIAVIEHSLSYDWAKLK